MGDRTGDASTSWQMFQQRTLHAASQYCIDKKPIHRGFQSVAELAAATAEAPPARPRKKKKVSSKLRKLQRELDKQTPEEREEFFSTVAVKRMVDYPEKFENKVVRRKLRSKLEAAANEKVLASGRPLEPQIVSEPRWKSNQKLDPYKVRPGAYKMVLPPEEEAKLQLDQFGVGIQLSPKWPWGYRLGGKEDFVFGIFGRSECAKGALEHQWARRDPEEVIWDQDYYEDILDKANNMELTVMVQTLRPLALAPLRRALGYRMGLAMRGLPIKGEEDPDRETPLVEVPLDAADTAAMESFLSTFDDKRLSKTDPGKQWVDRRGNVKQGTHLIFNVSPDFELHGEVITPGNLRDRKAYFLGKWKSRRLARAAFDLFLGEFPVDARAKAQAGQAILYVTNGFKLGPNPDNPNQQLIDEQGNPIDEFPHRTAKTGKRLPTGGEAGRDPNPQPAHALASVGSSWSLGRGVPLLEGLSRRFQGLLQGPGQGQAQGA